MAIETNSRGNDKVVRESRRGANFASLFVIAAGSGVPLGVALHNLPLGIAVGSFFGIAVGLALRLAGMGSGMGNTGTSARRWVYAIAAVGGLLLLVGMIILFELMPR